MITIVNMGPHDPQDKLGERTYELRINSEVITEFRHTRGNGLARCLEEAAKAVRRKLNLEAVELLRRFNA